MTSYSSSNKAEKVKIRMGKGMAEIDPKTLYESFDAVCAKHGAKSALHQKVITPVSKLLRAEMLQNQFFEN